MQTIELSSFKTSSIYLVIAGMCSLFTLWLVDSSIKYSLCAIEFATMIIVFLILDNRDIRSFPKNPFASLKHKRHLPEYSIVISSTLLIFANILSFSLGIFQLALALLCTSFLSGYLLLRIFGIDRYLSKLETIL